MGYLNNQLRSYMNFYFLSKYNVIELEERKSEVFSIESIFIYCISGRDIMNRK